MCFAMPPVEEKVLALDTRAYGEENRHRVHAMARNGDSEVVRRGRAGGGAYRLGRSNPPSDFGLGNLLARGNLLERVEYACVEGERDIRHIESGLKNK